MIGTRIAGRYTIERELGRGGMGVVYAAIDAGGRRVAIKAVLPEHATDLEFMERFRREGRAGAAVSHPNVVALVDSGEENGTPYLVFEYVPGPTLKAKVTEKGPLPWREAASVGAGVARGLAAIHAAGLVHRDLKPENVLLDAEGRPRISDLGLVGSQAASLAASHALTNTGDMLGTPAYMAPEQAGNTKGVGASADLYALGAVLHFLLTGWPPFSGAGLTLLRKHATEAPCPPSKVVPGIPRSVDRLVPALLAKEPARRPRSAEAVARELEAIAVAREPGRRRLAGLVVLAVFAAVAAGVSLAVKEKSTAAPATKPPPVPEPVPSLVEGPPRAKAPPLPPGQPLRRNLRPGPRVGTVETFLFRLPGNAGDMELVEVPAGKFVMGSDDPQALDDARPRHTETMDHAYWIGRNDVTWAQYRAFCEATRQDPPPEPDFFRALEPGFGSLETHPVILVSWEDASAYCQWAKLALPTEAEWEKAARGTDGRRYPWGADWDPRRSNFCDASCPFDRIDWANEAPKPGRWDRAHSDGFPFTSPVGSFPAGASPYGALDMAGNVFQLCAGWYDGDGQHHRGGRPNTWRPIRGGSWHDAPLVAGSFYRGGIVPTDRLPHVGFRVVLRP